MERIKVYMDNCCYNRPFDDRRVATIRDETYAKMYIQSLITLGSIDLVYSFMSLTEISDSIFEENKRQIMTFIEKYASFFIGENRQSDIEQTVKDIMQTGIKLKDATHIACALLAECHFFITTDKRLLKYKTEKMKIINPTDFTQILTEAT